MHVDEYLDDPKVLLLLGCQRARVHQQRHRASDAVQRRAQLVRGDSEELVLSNVFLFQLFVLQVQLVAEKKKKKINIR